MATSSPIRLICCSCDRSGLDARRIRSCQDCVRAMNLARAVVASDTLRTSPIMSSQRVLNEPRCSALRRRSAIIVLVGAQAIYSSEVPAIAGARRPEQDAPPSFRTNVRRFDVSRARCSDAPVAFMIVERGACGASPASATPKACLTGPPHCSSWSSSSSSTGSESPIKSCWRDTRLSRLLSRKKETRWSTLLSAPARCLRPCFWER